MKELIRYIATALVDKPEEVHVEAVDEGGETVLELEVAEEDLGKVIGRQGRTARAMRLALAAAATKKRERYRLEILE
jgi:hypothetical protein